VNAENVEVSVKRLVCGDYLVGRDLVVERKTITDFGYSVRDGRLFRQSARLVKAVDCRICIVLEDDESRTGRAPIPRNAFHGALITVTLIYGIPVLRSRGPRETAFLLVAAGRQLVRRKTLPPKRFYHNLSSDRRTQVLMLQAISDIGPCRALKLLKEFGNLENIVTASIEELAATTGIGKQTAHRIRSAASALDSGTDEL
jgi:ERCC4-type nuclease